MKIYAVITCDIVESRMISARARAQELVETGFEKINQRYSTHIAIPFQFTLGDEFQGVLDDYTKAPVVIGRLREEVAPVKVRVGVGIGKIATVLSSDVRKVDGPAFHAARDALGDLRGRQKDGLKLKQRLTGYKSESGYDDAINTVSMLYDVLINDRSEKQWLAARAYNITGSVTEAATVLNTTVPNASQIISAAHLHETNRAEEFLARYLQGDYKDGLARDSILKIIADGHNGG